MLGLPRGLCPRLGTIVTSGSTFRADSEARLHCHPTSHCPLHPHPRSWTNPRAGCRNSESRGSGNKRPPSANAMWREGMGSSGPSSPPSLPLTPDAEMETHLASRLPPHKAQALSQSPPVAHFLISPQRAHSQRTTPHALPPPQARYLHNGVQILPGC